MTEFLKHEGTKRHSGRYPWGSGDTPYQSDKNFIAYVNDLKRKGLSDKMIADGIGWKVNELRANKSIATNSVRKEDLATASKLKAKGYSDTAIGLKMGKNESSIRSLLNAETKARKEVTEATANMLKENLERKQYLDIGAGVERHIGLNRTKFRTAVAMLEEEGYTTHYIPVTQLGTGKVTTLFVLAKPGTTWSEVSKNRAEIKQIKDYTEDGGRSFLGLEPIRSIDSKRLTINYAEDGGTKKDGVIELRRGVDDISLGRARYAQVRIGVDDKHFLKGMAVYADDLPPGIDIRFNTNKSKTTPFDKVLKPMKELDGDIDSDNPFGSTVKQRHYIDKDGNKALSAINMVYEEGNWKEWSRSLSSQVLSKQHPSLAKKQLDLAFDIKKAEYDEIMALDNPVVKKKLLDTFADDCDSAAVHLKAAALPRQGSHVILPFPNMKENEIYAPNYRDGETVVLIRYPHGGTFEIPQLTVNNNYAPAKKILGNQSPDAVGINHKVAERLSGADFDGDTVLVIPNPDGKVIKSTAPLKGLIDFDPKALYKLPDSAPRVKVTTKNAEMGKVSNLIADMSMKGANDGEIARAVKHSMVVIDSEKHHLDYKQSAIDNDIAGLKTKYQGGARKGASTVISRASSDARPLARKDGVEVVNPETGKVKRVYVDPETGKKLYTYTGESYVNIKGKTVMRTTKSTKMYEADDAFSLSSGTTMETVYATHANKLKALGNETRKSAIAAASSFTKSDPNAKKEYAKEVASLKAKLNIALLNAPLERQAQLLANAVVASRKAANPDMDADDLKKVKGQALAEQRARIGAGKERVPVTPEEWNAIQKGAISTNLLKSILDNTDLDVIKQYATPRVSNGLTPVQSTRARNMLANGYSQADIAEFLGVSTNSINSIAN